MLATVSKVRTKKNPSILKSILFPNFTKKHYPSKLQTPMKFWLPVFLCVILLYSCDSFDFSDQPQGIIEYDVTYLENRSSMPTNLLPHTVTLKFRSSKSITTIDGFMGMFSMSNISDFKKHTNTMLLKVMDNKYFQPGEKYDPPFFFDGLENIEVRQVNETKVIAGLSCKKAVISFPDSTQAPFVVYYTDQIKLKNCNKANPFSSLDGVLMQFNIRFSNIEMLLTANKYKIGNVSEDLFKVPKNYKKVSKEKMSGVIAKLLE